ncbi:MAG: RagB/SusD family nutrient uptake outer membrane protein [Flavobacterium sp.]
MKTFKKHIADYKRKCLLLLVMIGFFSSCEDFTEIDQPDSQLTGETVFNNVETAEAALANIYLKLSNEVLVCGNSKGISILLGSYADELQTYNTGLGEYQFFLNNLVPTTPEVKTIWNGCYNLIYAANAVKEGVGNSTGINAEAKNRLIGEALFIRAYIHFYLLNLYGEIPYVTTTDYVTNASIEKLPQTQVYQLMIEDLEEAKLLMPATNPSILKVRPGIDAVRSLLARIHLYQGSWENAEIEATAVIDSGNYIWVESLDNVFLKNSTGTIWQIMPGQDGLPTQEGQSFVFTSAPPPNRALNQNLVDSFEPTDLRKQIWIGNVTDNGQTWYYAYKYKQSASSTESSEYSILFRLEELYLIRAEARVHLGSIDTAKEDINKIRNRASLINVTTNNDEELLEVITQERRLELFCELGHRFFDLRRTGTINPVLTLSKPGWNSTDILLPKPESELLLNPNLLPQNPGY